MFMARRSIIRGRIFRRYPALGVLIIYETNASGVSLSTTGEGGIVIIGAPKEGTMNITRVIIKVVVDISEGFCGNRGVVHSKN